METETDVAPKKRGRPRIKTLSTRGTAPSGLRLISINGSMFYDQYGRVLEESEGADRIVDLRPIGLWNFGSKTVIRPDPPEEY